MKKEQPNVDSLEPNVDSLRSNVASKDAPCPHIYAVGQKVLNHYCKSEILTIGELAGHADKNNVSEEEREIIKEKLRAHYLSVHPDYQEKAVQLELEF